MQLRVSAEFGVEGAGEEGSLLDEDDFLVVGGEDFDGWADFGDDWGADEGGVKFCDFSGWNVEFGIEAVGLFAVGAALDGDVHQAEVWRDFFAFNVFGQQNCSGAGAPDWEWLLGVLSVRFDCLHQAGQLE